MAETNDNTIYDNYTSTSTNITDENYFKEVEQWKVYLENQILNRINLPKEAKILEIGCGWGGLLKALRDEGYEDIRGCDLSSQQIDFAKRKGGLNNVKVSDAVTYLTEQKTKFDIIFMIDVLEHLELDESIKVIKIVKEKLVEGGSLVIQVPNGLSFVQVCFFSDITHKRAYTPVSMKQILKLCGFEKFNHYEPVNKVKGWKLKIANLLYVCIFRPVNMLYVFCLTYSTFGRIYSANLLTIAKK